MTGPLLAQAAREIHIIGRPKYRLWPTRRKSAHRVSSCLIGSLIPEPSAAHQTPPPGSLKSRVRTCPRRRPPLFQQLIQRRLEGLDAVIPYRRVVNVHILLLTNAIGTVGRLILFCRVPATESKWITSLAACTFTPKPTATVERMISREPRLLLELIDQLLPALRTLAASAGIAIDHRGFRSQNARRWRAAARAEYRAAR